jgi:hypothetical protein
MAANARKAISDRARRWSTDSADGEIAEMRECGVSAPAAVSVESVSKGLAGASRLRERDAPATAGETPRYATCPRSPVGRAASGKGD